jgi:diketogulonate reductase-like aldo/keto reductase
VGVMAGFKLNSGAVMPVIGMGIGMKEDRTVDAILAAIEVSTLCSVRGDNAIEPILWPVFPRPNFGDGWQIGYRCFDTARWYTTEPLLGEALAKAFKAGLVRREDVFVTTKLHPADTDDVVTALRSSLR